MQPGLMQTSGRQGRQVNGQHRNFSQNIESKSNRGVSIGDTLAALGKVRNGGSYKYIKKLFEQWGCKTYRKGCGLYYYLDKEGSQPK